MAKPQRIVSSVTDATFGLWFPFFRFMARTLAPVWVARLSEATAERAIWSREHVHEAILENFSRVLSLPARDRRVEAAGREMVSRHSRFWIDLLRYAGREPAATAHLLTERSGDEALLAAHAEGRGAILLTAHVGNFELGGIFLAQIGLEDNYAVYAPDPSPVIEAHREKARRSLGVTGIPVTSSPFAFVPILRALAANGVVAMQGDRDVSGTGRSFPFFGEMTSFPVGPFRIAAMSGAPLFPAFVLQDDEREGHYRSVIEPPIRIPPTDSARERDEAIEAAMRQFVSSLSGMITKHPTQWYHFKRYWAPA
jgi:KDO2-lipid IV(A) lauroyltransferase